VNVLFAVVAGAFFAGVFVPDAPVAGLEAGCEL
jgi:hypothetical protein